MNEKLDSEDYRRFAEECLRIAQGAKPHHRVILKEMAETWFMLAAEAEKTKKI